MKLISTIISIFIAIVCSICQLYSNNEVQESSISNCELCFNTRIAVGRSAHARGSAGSLAGYIGSGLEYSFGKHISGELFLNASHLRYKNYDNYLLNRFGDTIQVYITISSIQLHGGFSLKIKKDISENAQVFYRFGFNVPYTLQSTQLAEYLEDDTMIEVKENRLIQEFGEMVFFQQEAGITFSSFEASLIFQEPLNFLFTSIPGYYLLAFNIGYRIPW